MCVHDAPEHEPRDKPGVLDTLSGLAEVVLAVGVVAVFAVTYWALPSPESRL
jgi:hypothetical protein